MKRFVFGAFPLIACAFSASALGGTVSGQVAGTWLNPVLAGSVINLDGSNGPQNNTLTAIYSTSPSNDLKWGTNTQIPPPSIYSEVIFQGNTLTNVPSGQEVALGTLTFLNGTSTLESLLFGATLRIFVPGNLSVTPLDAQMGIFTTVNSGTCVPCDADYIQFSNVNIGNTLNVFEGETAVFTVLGKFVGDPQIVLTRYALAPGGTGGFVGNGQPSQVPEPASTAAIAVGLAVIAIQARGRKHA